LKIKEKLQEIELKHGNSIKNIVGYFIVVFILVMRQWNIATKPYLVSEDGSIFIDRAINGRLSALITSYAGYYHFIPQFLVDTFYTFCKIINNVIFLPHMMWGSSVLIAALIVFYFTGERFSWVLEKRSDRLIVCCLIVLLSINEISDLHGTLTNIQWWLGFFFFMISLNIFHKREMPSIVTVIFLILCGFSTATIFALFMMFAVMITFKILKHKLYKSDIIKFTMILIPTVVQLWGVLHSKRVSEDILTYKKILGVVPSFFNLLGKLVTPQSINFYQYRMIMLGIILFALLIYILREIKWFAAFSLLYSLLFLAFCILPIAGNQNNISIATGNYFAVSENVGGRYWFVTLMIMQLLLSVAFVKIWNKLKENLVGGGGGVCLYRCL
jgi:hypothetical protein